MITRGKQGWYKGIYCNSSWELAFVIYCLEHNKLIQRCKQKLPYYVDTKKYNYYPDFKVDNKLVQIKGYENDKWKYKQQQYPNITILRESDLKEVFSYVISKYGKNFTKLYES